MSPIDECHADIQYYNDIISKLNYITECLKGCAFNVEPIRNTLRDSCTVNNSSMPVVGKCSSLYDDIWKVIHYINKVIIPDAYVAIGRRREDIANLQK